MFSGHLRLFEDVLTLGCWIYNFQISKREASSFFFSLSLFLFLAHQLVAVGGTATLIMQEVHWL